MWYEGQGLTESLAKKAPHIITIYKLTARSHGGTDFYMISMRMSGESGRLENTF